MTGLSRSDMSNATFPAPEWFHGQTNWPTAECDQYLLKDPIWTNILNSFWKLLFEIYQAIRPSPDAGSAIHNKFIQLQNCDYINYRSYRVIFERRTKHWLSKTIWLLSNLSSKTVYNIGPDLHIISILVAAIKRKGTALKHREKKETYWNMNFHQNFKTAQQ